MALGHLGSVIASRHGSPLLSSSPGTCPNFADYNATYGSLGAVIGFMLWIWISMVILLSALS